MSINFSQFPTPTLPIQPGDFVVGYQLPGTGGIPTLAQYSMLQLFAGVFPGGTVPVSQGGTGLTVVPTGDVLVGNNSTQLSFAIPGTAGGMLISQGTSTLPIFANNPVLNGATTVTLGPTDNSTLVASDAFVNQQIIRATATVPLAVVGGVYNQASLGAGLQIVVLAAGGVINGILTIAVPGTGYAVGDILGLPAGNSDAVIRVTAVGGGGSVTTVQILYGGTGYNTGIQITAFEIPPGQRTVTLTGVLTSNVTFIIQNGTLNTASRRVEFNNNTTGAFTVTVKLSNGAGGSVGTGVVLPQGTNNSSALLVQTDGVNDVWLAETPLGIGAVSSTNPVITGGTINNTTVGATTPSTGAFTTLAASGNDALLYSNSSAQSFTSGSLATVTGWTKTFDRVNTNFNAATGVFTAPVTGFYQVSSQVQFASHVNAVNAPYTLNIVVNGVAIANGITFGQSTSTDGQAVTVSAVVNAAAGQTIVVQASQTSGVTVALSTGGGSPVNYLSINRVP